MAPTLAWHPDGNAVALGSPGASRIASSIVQTWSRYLLEGMSLEDAVEAPRLHVEPVGNQLRLQYEPGIDTALAGSEFTLRPFDAPGMYFGAVKLAALDSTGHLHAVADRRRQGATEIYYAD
jgi:gamma-glutamyltranspeptidase/glutathione hydrolase